MVCNKDKKINTNSVKCENKNILIIILSGFVCSYQFFYPCLTFFCYFPEICLQLGLYNFERLTDEINVNEDNEQNIISKI